MKFGARHGEKKDSKRATVDGRGWSLKWWERGKGDSGPVRREKEGDALSEKREPMRREIERVVVISEVRKDGGDLRSVR